MNKTILALIALLISLMSVMAVSAQQVTVTPATPLDSENLECTLNYLYDSSGNQMSVYNGIAVYDFVYYNWYSNSGKSQAGTGPGEGRTLSETQTEAGEQWVCKIFFPPILGGSPTDTGLQAGVTILDASGTDVSVDLIEITPTEPTVDDTLSCDVSGQNLGDAVTYSWKKNGVVDSGATAATYDSTNTAYNDVMACVVYLDILGVPTSVGEVSTTIDARISGVTVDVTQSGNDFTCDITNGLGDYNTRWYINGVENTAFQDALTITQSVSTGDTIRCDVTTRIYDNSVGTDTETIGTTTSSNNAPMLSSDDVSPNDGDEDTDFLFIVTYTDADNEAPTSVTLTVDGSNYAMSASPGQDGNYANGEVYEISIDNFDEDDYTYSIIATDGTDNSNTVTGSFEVEEDSDKDDNVRIKSIKFTSGIYVRAGDQMRVSVTIAAGNDDIKNLRFTASINELGISSNSGLFIVDDRESETRSVFLDIPDTASGEYEVKLMLTGDNLLEIAYRAITIESVQSDFNIVTVAEQEGIPPPLNAKKDGGFPWLILFELLLLLAVAAWIIYMLGGFEKLRQWYAARKTKDSEEVIAEDQLATADAAPDSEESVDTTKSYY